MMRWIIESSMRLQFLVIVLTAVLIVFGIVQLREMPVDVFPEFDPPMIQIQTEALGLAAEEVEAFVTTPLEADLLNGVAWLDEIYSESVAGLSSVLLVFEPGTDPIRARQMVQERLTLSYALPKVSKPPVMLQPLSTTSRVMAVGLSSEDVSLIDISLLAHWNIKPRLIGVPGVANVAIWGQRDWQLQVQVDPERLDSAGVTLNDIVATTGNALWASPLSYLKSSTPGNAGWIDTPNQRLTIMHLLPISRAESMAQIPIIGHEGLLLGDVTEVVEDHQPLIGDAILGNGSSLMLVVEKFPGANTLEVTRGVEAALEAMKPGLGGIQIDTTVFRPANYIEQAASNLSTVIVAGALLMMVVFVAFFFGWRSLVVSMAAISVSFLAALLVLYLRGATFNMMILAGLVIALVIIVDDVIVDVDRILTRMRQNRELGNERPAASVIVEAMMETRSPLIFAFLIIVLAILPIFLLEGMSGAFFMPLATSYLIAVLVSLLVALIVTPTLSLMLLANPTSVQRESALVQGLRSVYQSILAPILYTRYSAVIGMVVLAAVGVAALLSLQLSLIPTLSETNLRIEWNGAPGTSHPEMVRVLSRTCDELRTVAGVQNCGSHVGRAVTGDQVVGINSGELWISLDPAADYDMTISEVRQIVDGYPGLSEEIETYQPDHLNAALMGPTSDVVVRVYGNDFDTLQAKAEEIGVLVSEVDGVTETQVEALIQEPQVEIEVSLAAAERYQTSPGAVRRAATTMLSGLPVGNLYEEQKVFDVVVIAAPELRRSLTDIQELLIDTPSGLVRLGDLADVRVASTPIVVKRNAVSRYLDVQANVSGRDISAVMADIRDRLPQVDFPLEFRAEVLDEGITWQNATQRIQIITVIVVFGVFFLFQAAFKSWNLAIVALLSLPVALVGGVLAVFLSGGVLTLGSLFGFLAILGVAVRSIIVMTVHLQRLQQQSVSFGSAQVLRGASERLIPVLITTIATGLALLPLILGGNVAGNEIVRPTAIVILGGLVTSAILTLFILPALYLLFAPDVAPSPQSLELDSDDMPDMQYA